MAFEQNPFAIETIKDAQDLIARDDADNIQRNLDYYYGNHWQDGNGWSGPIPSTTDSDYASVKTEIERGFKSKNVVKEVTDRAANAVTGKTALWSIVPKRKVTLENPVTDSEQSLIDEAEELLRQWMDEKDFETNLSKSLRQTLLSGKSTLRLYIPAGFVEDGEVIVDTGNPVGNLYLSAPSPLAAGIQTDENSMERCSVFLGKLGEDDTAELSYLLPEANERNQRLTEIVLLVGKEETTQTVAEVQLDLSGKLPVFQLEMPRLTTEQIISLQKGINLNLTMMERNSVLGGFLERIILNGQLPGHFEEDEDTGERYFVRDEFMVGAGSVNAIQGNPIVDENTGNINGYTTPGIVYKDPQAPTTFLTAADSMYQMILQECDQIFSTLAAQASGDAQRQAVASFFSYLRTPKQQTDKAGKWTLETVLAFAAFLVGSPDKFASLKVNFESRLDTGAVPTAELDIIERYVRVGIMSLETARERAGIEYPEIEAQRVRQEKENRDTTDIQSNDRTSLETGLDIENVDNNDVNVDNNVENDTQ